jgi:hypothetical protein
MVTPRRDRIEPIIGKSGPMSPSPLLVAAAALTFLAFGPARAETVSQTLDGTSLAIDVACVDTVDIQPQAGLAGKVMVEATSSDADDLKDFVFTGGATASVTRAPHTVCLKITDITRKITVAIKVPAGMAIDIKNGGSTDYAIGAVGGSLRARLAGSGNVSAESVTELALSIAGSSDAKIAQLSGPADISIAGSGNVKIANAAVPSMKIDVRGSGDVSVDQGQIGSLSASVAGSGDLRIKANVQDAALSTVGSGDIDVAKVAGSLSSSKTGSGSIRIGRAGPG